MLFFLFPLPLFITLFYILLAYIIVWLNIELCLRQGNIIIRTQTCHLVRNSFHKKYKITWYICTYARCKNELGSWDSSTLFSFCSDFYLIYIILSHIRRESFAIYFVFIVSYIISLKKKKITILFVWKEKSQLMFSVTASITARYNRVPRASAVWRSVILLTLNGSLKVHSRTQKQLTAVLGPEFCKKYHTSFPHEFSEWLK